MHKHYIINNIVEFHPAASTLRDLRNPDRVVVLNSPAGRCLLLLIERAGTIVTQQEFLDIVWKSRGMLVSSNTYYQNISILRKGLKKIGFDVDPIVTIPRIGLTLASDTQITIKEPYPVSPEVTEEWPDEAQAMNTSLTLSERVAESAPEAHAFFLRLRGLVSVALILLILTGGAIVAYDSVRESRFVDDYRFNVKVGACHVYLANDINTQDERAKMLGYMEQFKEDCANYPWVYISWYASLPRASVFRCDRPMNESNRCISDYFIEDLQDDPLS